MPQPTGAPDGAGPIVTLTVPADSAYVSVLRTTTTALAARADFTLDDIEDLRIAVGEACAMVLERATPGGELQTGFEMSEGGMRIHIWADAPGASTPDRDGWAWQVLAAMTFEVSARTSGDRFGVLLDVRSDATLAGRR